MPAQSSQPSEHAAGEHAAGPRQATGQEVHYYCPVARSRQGVVLVGTRLLCRAHNPREAVKAPTATAHGPGRRAGCFHSRGEAARRCACFAAVSACSLLVFCSGAPPPLQCAVALYIYSKLAIALPGGQRHWSMRRRVGPPPVLHRWGTADRPVGRRLDSRLRRYEPYPVTRKQDCTLLCTSSTQTGRQGCRELLCSVHRPECAECALTSSAHLLVRGCISLVVSLFVYTKVYFISAAPVPLGVYWLPYYRTEL